MDTTPDLHRSIGDEPAAPTPHDAPVPVAALLPPGAPDSATDRPATSDLREGLLEPSASGNMSIASYGEATASSGLTPSSAPPRESRPETAPMTAPMTAPPPPVPSAFAARTAIATSWLLAPLLILSENWYARRTSRRLVALYRHVRAEQPSMTGRALYEEVVVRWTGLERTAARTILARAAQSFVDWNTDRDLRFRDVVLYLIVDDYVRSHPGRHGVVARMGSAVAQVVANTL